MQQTHKVKNEKKTNKYKNANLRALVVVTKNSNKVCYSQQTCSTTH